MDPGMNWVLFGIIGFIAGVTGKDLRSGKVGSIVLGIVGACVGGGILEWSRFIHSLVFRMGLIQYDLIISLIMAALGALFALFLLRLVKEG